jgi:ABC-2 type transport system permease protein/sodium transport system permease protein
MPILVYPLLSLALNRLLLTAKRPGEATNYIIGVESDSDGASVINTVQTGFELIRQDRKSAIQIIRSSPAKTELPGLANVSGLTSEINAEQQTSAASELDNESLKVESSPARSTENALDKLSDESAEKELRGFDVSLASDDLDQALKDRDIDIAVRMRPPSPGSRVAFDVQYRPGDAISVNALEDFADLLRLINDTRNQQLFLQKTIPSSSTVTMTARPTETKDNSSNSFLALIPLVLLLMTITGAVYPAIDLTAGERERGTMESLIAAPISRHLLLMSKYVAVVTVAMLTALANLTAMWVTLWATGIDKVLAGGAGISPVALLQILPLLLLFACFFSAVLLALCSFARSFKEAQAYLIPVMLLSLAPGIVSLMPNIEFSPSLAIVPLVNIVLLARDILTGNVTTLPLVISIASTLVYTLAVISIAAKLFGSDASSSGADTSWSELLMTNDRQRGIPDFSMSMVFLALLFPIYFVASSLSGRLSGLDLQLNAFINASITFVLFVGLPLLYARLLQLRLPTTFRLGFGQMNWFLMLTGVLLVSLTTWVFAHESFVIAKMLGIGSLSDEQMQMAEGLLGKFKAVPLWILLFTMAIVPAVCEEFFFRGFLLSSMSRWNTLAQIVTSAVLFGLFHVLSGSALMIERFIPSTLLGLVLATIAIQSGSIWLGVLMHAIHNGLMFTLIKFEDRLRTAGWDVENSSHLPLSFIVTAALSVALGLLLIVLAKRKSPPTADIPDSVAIETS